MKNQKTSHWYKNAIVYGLDIETFFDANGDGIGDFKGATAKLPYLSELGINCIWILPFYPTSNRDNGYDVISYTNVDQRLGTLNDFRTFVDEAKKYNIRILIDLVIHHTSNQHPWFIAATTDRNSQYYDYYIWTDKLPPKPHDENIFPTKESGVWRYDEYAKRYYHHKFYHFEPDLNIANPQVQEEILKIMDFWLTFNIDGFRIDAATHLFESKGLSNTDIKNPANFIKKLRTFIENKKPEAIILGEADVEPEKIKQYIGGDNRFHLLFNFLLNNNLFLSLATKKTQPIIDRLKQLQKASPPYHWLNFIRNLDELDLEQLSENDRKRIYTIFAPDPNMRVYGRGIRRRIASMLKGNSRWLKMTYSLLFSFPGSPMIVYGDEIGMGDDLSLPERVSVRTPMQWSDEKNAGFSTAKESQLIRNIITTGNLSYKNINVQSQQNDPNSLLACIKTLITIKQKYPEIANSSYPLINLDNESALSFYYKGDNHDFLILHNLSHKEITVTHKEYTQTQYEEIISDGTYPQREQNHNSIPIHGFGFRWFIKKQ